MLASEVIVKMNTGRHDLHYGLYCIIFTKPNIIRTMEKWVIQHIRPKFNINLKFVNKFKKDIYISNKMQDGTITKGLEDIVIDLADEVQKHGLHVDMSSVVAVVNGSASVVKFTHDKPLLEITVTEDTETDPKYNQVTVTFTYKIPHIYFPIAHEFGFGARPKLEKLPPKFVELTLPSREHLLYFFRNYDYARIERETGKGSLPVWFKVSDYDSGSGKINASFTMGFDKNTRLQLTPQVTKVLAEFINYVSDYHRTQATMVMKTEPEPRAG